MVIVTRVPLSSPRSDGATDPGRNSGGSWSFFAARRCSLMESQEARLNTPRSRLQDSRLDYVFFCRSLKP